MVVAVFALALGSLTSCSDDDAPPLLPVRDCKTDQECQDADPRHDVCTWVCEAQVTYCRVSCETDEDCLDRGLPADYVYCDIPRPGEGFCNQYDYDYKPDGCIQDVPPTNPSDNGGG
ncbi:MAG: hypothetical protein K0V04_03735 [Deltaproteobacteria bacterium]|nr:hypothetical protein [Deltaproteobacteria bacterium]